MNSIWTESFPPFIIWLYGKLTRELRNQPVITSPSDAWRQLENDLKEVPEPKNLIQKVICGLVKAKLRGLAEKYHTLDNMGVSLIGYFKE